MTPQSLDADDAVDVEEWFEDLTYKEVHLFVEGLYRGISNLSLSQKKLQGKVVGDSWYAKGGWIVGKLIHALLLGGAAEIGGVI